jgi:hypothetical protein
MRTVLTVLLTFVLYNTFGQNAEITRHLKLVIGGGYGHFFNNFTNVLDEDVITNKPAFEGKLLWQPEHRLRIGVESGYYFMYSTTRVQTDGGSERLTTNLNVVPLFMSFSMKVVNNFELNFASGWASMIYVIQVNKSKKNKVVGHTYSMSNISAGCTYYLPLGKKFDIGAEFKYLYLGKTDDQYASLSINLAYKLVTWRRNKF